MRPLAAVVSRLSSYNLAHRLRRIGRRLGMRTYHRLAAFNYARRLVARRRSTPAGPYYCYEPAWTAEFDPLLSALADAVGPTDTVYDIGAYAGRYAIPLARAPGRTVVAVEPDPTSRARLHANRERTAPAGDVIVRPVGAGAESDHRPFYHSSFPKLSSFDRADATRWGAQVTAVESVPVQPLDALAEGLPAPDHIKIDVEGLAPAVLAGGIDTIDRHRPTLLIEPHDRPGTDRTAAIRSWCDAHNYEVTGRERALVCRPTC